MSETPQSLIIRTGKDPRNFQEFNAIRNEINKINHPARPEVNWHLVETQALALFYVNGIDLQTAVYYTLARTKRHGLQGFTEGCELLTGIIVSQWDQLWPEQSQARSDILEWFNSRVGNQLRQCHFSNDDLRMVYRSERALQLIVDKLQQVKLNRMPRITDLLYLMQNTVKKIEKAETAVSRSASAPLHMPPLVYLPIPETPVQDTAQPSDLTANRDSQPSDKISVAIAPPAKTHSVWTGFALGVLCCLLVSFGIYSLHIRPMQQQLDALAANPEGQTLLWISRPDIDTYGEQIRSLEALSPLNGLKNADVSVAMARQLWPDDPRQQTESQRWENLLAARASVEKDNQGYFQVQQQLQALENKLLEQEKARGGITISYLKTAVYQMQAEMKNEVPLEELLRQLALAQSQHQPVSPLLLKQIDDRWNALLSRYHQLMRLTASTS